MGVALDTFDVRYLMYTFHAEHRRRFHTRHQQVQQDDVRVDFLKEYHRFLLVTDFHHPSKPSVSESMTRSPVLHPVRHTDELAVPDVIPDLPGVAVDAQHADGVAGLVQCVDGVVTVEDIQALLDRQAGLLGVKILLREL